MCKKIFGLLDGIDIESDATNKDAWKERKYLAYSILWNSVERKLLALSWTVRLSVKSGLLCCLSTNQKTSENLHELQNKFFQAVILRE